jgi:hypothetical protein
MSRKIFPVLFFFFITSISKAQNSVVTGMVKDTTVNAPVKNAVVLVLSANDSILRSFTRSNDDGTFTLKNVPAGKNILMVQHPQFADYIDDIQIGSSRQALPPIPVTSKSKLLAAVIIKSGSPIRIKGDTTIYTADSFNVSANANVEELLKKLPGIQVDKNGEIKAMGQKVEKVLVDGDEFFGDDPGMAVKNLRADAVKEVQVFDKKSEQAEFTGIDDGKTQKTINLKLKEDKKRGYFGKIGLAGGISNDVTNRFNNNLMFGSFKGKRKLSLFVLNGNTGQNGLSWQDSDKYGGNDDSNMSFDDENGYFMYSWQGGSSDDEPYINTENGFIRNVNAGMQYSNKWNDKTSFNFSPKYNLQDYSNLKNTYTQTQVLDSINNKTILFDRNQTSNMTVKRNNFKNTAVYEIKIDSNNTLKLTARANFYQTESTEYNYSNTVLREDSSQVNASNGTLRKNIDKQAINTNAIFKHKFNKARRTLSLNVDWNLLNTNGNNFTRTYNESFFPANVIELDQMIDSKKSTQKLTSKLVYTEPLNKKYSLELGYEISYSYGKNDQNSYSYSGISGKYDELVDSLTNKFRQSITINKPNVKLSYNHKKIKFNFGSGIGITQFRLNDISKNKDYDRNFTNIFPAAGFVYNYKTNHSLRFNYNGNTTQPTINQLQPLQNNTDQFNRYIGNPDLKPSFVNNFNVTHNGYNFLKEMWTYQSLNISVTDNSITNNRSINKTTGATTTQPINTDGNISANLWAGVGFKSKKLNTRFQISPNANYFRYADVINNVKSFSKTLNAGLSFNATKSKDKKYDFSFSNNLNYNNNKNTQNSTRTNFYTNTLALNGTVYYKKVWSLNTEWQYFHRQKTLQFPNYNDNQLWNAKLQRTFKNDQFTVFIQARDILNQNIGIERSFSGNYVNEERNQRLKRYFMLGFSWDFKNKGAAPTSK